MGIVSPDLLAHLMSSFSALADDLNLPEALHRDYLPVHGDRGLCRCKGDETGGEAHTICATFAENDALTPP